MIDIIHASLCNRHVLIPEKYFSQLKNGGLVMHEKADIFSTWIWDIFSTYESNQFDQEVYDCFHRQLLIPNIIYT